MSAIDRYLNAVDAAVPSRVTGLLVCGSLALGDYRPERSDIDVVVVVDEPLSPSERALVAEVHRVVATRVDGPYVPTDALRGAPEDVGEVPYHVDGRFEFGACHEVSPITWTILANQAITVRGAEPAALGVHSDDAAVRTFSTDNLRGYWANWAQTMASLLNGIAEDDVVEARLLEWGALGAPRVHCAATTGQVVSKSDAGQYAIETLGDGWRDIVPLALESRMDEIDEVRADDLRHTCALVRELCS